MKNLNGKVCPETHRSQELNLIFRNVNDNGKIKKLLNKKNQ